MEVIVPAFHSLRIVCSYIAEIHTKKHNFMILQYSQGNK